jgi:CYTH domain-containing protein
MGVEIERKFLLSSDSWRKDAVGVPYTQGYISKDQNHTVRVRIAGTKGFITIKGAVKGISRPEFEYAIPVDDARELMKLCRGPLIEKTRFRINHDGLVWEIDEFCGENKGLVIAEVELSDAAQQVNLPSWIGREVSGDPRYYNSSLSSHPFSSWIDKDQ